MNEYGIKAWSPMSGRPPSTLHDEIFEYMLHIRTPVIVQLEEGVDPHRAANSLRTAMTKRFRIRGYYDVRVRTRVVGEHIVIWTQWRKEP